MNLEAMEDVVALLRSEGVLGAGEGALVASALSLAAQVDKDPSNASIWKEYLAVQEDLRGIAAGSDSAFERLLDELSSSVGDSSDSGAKNIGAKTRGDR